MTNNRTNSESYPREIHHVGKTPMVHVVQANCELDLHADTSVAGANFTVIEFTNQVCNVIPFAKSYESKKNIPIVKAVTAYDDEKSVRSAKSQQSKSMAKYLCLLTAIMHHGRKSMLISSVHGMLDIIQPAFRAKQPSKKFKPLPSLTKPLDGQSL
jgi:hypothetical protein